MSNAIRNIQKRKSQRRRKGLGSTGERKGPAALGRATIPRKGKAERAPTYRASCHRCHGTGEVGRLGGRPVSCSCIPGAKPKEASHG